MAVCDLCGAEFDPSEAEDEFESEFGILSYGNLEKTLCGKCAIEVINCKVDGVYFETCERCEKRFDYIEDSAADADANFVLIEGGQIAEVQATAEGATYDEEGLLRLLRLARIGCDRIFAAQAKAVA